MAASAGARGAWIAAGVVAAFAAPLCLAEPYWQTVDDAFMAMVAHGYGCAAYASPALIFSSVLYGELLQAAGTHTIAGAQTYGVLVYAQLAAAASAAGYALWRAGVPGPHAAAALIVAFAPAALYPQFTVVAGLLAVAAALLVLAHATVAATALGAGMLVLAAVVRAEAAAFTLALTAPLWASALRRAPRRQVVAAGAAAALFAAAAAAAFVADRWYYSQPEWAQFDAMNRARLAFTDYGLRQYFFREPLDAMRLGWTPNDLVMVEGWFYADPRVYTPALVAELARQVWLPGFILSNTHRYPELLAFLRDEGLVALALLAAYAAWRARSRAALWTLGLVLGAIVALWLLGRPGQTRIYFAPLAGSAFLTLMAHPLAARRGDSVYLALGVVLLAGALGARNAADRAEEREARAQVCTLPPERLYVVWGDRLQYEKLYRPLSAPGDDCRLQVYSLAVPSYAPYALEQLRRATGAGDVIAALIAGKEIDLIADGWQVDVLRRHLRIHYGRVLDWRLLRGDGGRGTWFRLWLRAR